jgi:hypothetical protein
MAAKPLARHPKQLTTASRRKQDRRLKEATAILGEETMHMLIERYCRIPSGRSWICRTSGATRPLRDSDSSSRNREEAMTELIDHRAILARAEQIIDLLRTCHVREGWRLDEEGAERTLRYFRRMAKGGRDNNREYTAAREFLYRNGQSLDWVISGDPRGMICGAAAQSGA